MLLLSTAALASADNFNFTYTGNFGDTASGTLVTTAQGGGQFLITDITNGLIDGVPIVALIPPGIMGNNDNLLFVPPAPTYLDFNGFAFFDANGNGFILNYSGGYDLSGANRILDFGGTFTLTPIGTQVPEPGSMLLFGTGLLGIVGVLRLKSFSTKSIADLNLVTNQGIDLRFAELRQFHAQVAIQRSDEGQSTAVAATNATRTRQPSVTQWESTHTQVSSPLFAAKPSYVQNAGASSTQARAIGQRSASQQLMI